MHFTRMTNKGDVSINFLHNKIILFNRFAKYFNEQIYIIAVTLHCDFFFQPAIKYQGSIFPFFKHHFFTAATWKNGPITYSLLRVSNSGSSSSLFSLIQSFFSRPSSVFISLCFCSGVCITIYCPFLILFFNFSVSFFSNV